MATAWRKRNPRSCLRRQWLSGNQGSAQRQLRAEHTPVAPTSLQGVAAAHEGIGRDSPADGRYRGSEVGPSWNFWLATPLDCVFRYLWQAIWLDRRFIMVKENNNYNKEPCKIDYRSRSCKVDYKSRSCKIVYMLSQSYRMSNGQGLMSNMRHDPKKHSPSPTLGIIDKMHRDGLAR
jgi:hypothetical protein